MDNDKPKANFELDPSQTAPELQLLFGVGQQAILTHLAHIGKVKIFRLVVST